MNTPPQQLHIPVLLDDVLRLLNPQQGEHYLDLTAGYGGHARRLFGALAGRSMPRCAIAMIMLLTI